MRCRISARSATALDFFLSLSHPLTLSFCLARADLFSHSVTVALGASSNTTVFAANHNYCSILPAAKSSADTEQLTRTDTHTHIHLYAVVHGSVKIPIARAQLCMLFKKNKHVRANTNRHYTHTHSRHKHLYKNL